MNTRSICFIPFVALLSLAVFPWANAQSSSGTLFSPDSPCSFQSNQVKCTVRVIGSKSNTPFACIWVPDGFKIFRCFSSDRVATEWPHANQNCCLLSLRAHPINPFTDPRWDGNGSAGAQAIFNEAPELATLHVSGDLIVGDRFFNPFPKTGAWSALDDSRSGMLIEIQNGILAGTYFGANPEGNNVWLKFSGTLEARIPEGAPEQRGWRLETDLTQFTGAGCIINCGSEANPPMPVGNAVGTIVLEFAGRNEAVLRVDGGAPVAMTPVIFGNPAWAFVPNEPLKLLPNLAGDWVMVTDADGDGFGTEDGAEIIKISGPEVLMFDQPAPDEPFLEVNFTITFFASSFEPRIQCQFFMPPTNFSNPSCLLRPSLSAPMTVGRIPFETITDSRFTDFSTDDVLNTARTDFIRLNYD